MAGVSFNWDSYQQAPDAGGLTGQPLTLDTNWASQPYNPNNPADWGVNPVPQPGNTNVWGTTPGGTYSPFGGGTVPPGYQLTNAPGGDTPGYNYGYVPAGSMTTSQGAPAGVDGASATPPIPPAIASNGSGQTYNPGDPQAFFNQLFPGQTLTPQMLADNEAALNAQGIKIIRNAAGQPSKIQLPDGSVVDPIIGAGSGQNQKAWNVVAGPGGVATGGGDTSGYGSLNGLNAGFMTSPIGQFTPPSYQDALNDPGAQYAINEAQRTMQNSAAARGTLLNGRQLQAQNNAILGDANTLYGDIYNRAANTYGINFNTQTRNQDAPFQKYYQLSSLGQQAAAAS